jgi:hypothetical protein
MSRDSGLTVGEVTTDLHADRRHHIRQALDNSRPNRFEPGRHRAKPEQLVAELSEPTVGPTVRWDDTTLIRAVPEGPTEQLNLPAPPPSPVLPSRKPAAAWLAELWNGALARGLGALRNRGVQ